MMEFNRSNYQRRRERLGYLCTHTSPTYIPWAHAELVARWGGGGEVYLKKLPHIRIKKLPLPMKKKTEGEKIPSDMENALPS